MKFRFRDKYILIVLFNRHIICVNYQITAYKILKSIWDDSGNFIDDNTLSVHVSRLREKIGADKIATVRGIGYRWEENI